MAKGSSGRIVIEIEPYLKEELYVVLDREGLTLKEWFLSNVGTYLASNGSQLPLALPDNEKPSKRRSIA